MHLPEASLLALTYVSIALLSIALPIGVFIGRNNVRSSRGKLIEELEKLLAFGGDREGTLLTSPSFELVKYKYDPARDPIGGLSWILPVGIYVVLSFLGFVTALGHPEQIGLHLAHNTFLEAGKTLEPAQTVIKVKELIGVLSYAFLGGYIWTIQYLIRRVANFDLKPLSFVRCAVHILLGAFVSAAAWHLTGDWGGEAFALSPALAFLVGMQPTLLIDKLVARFSFMQLRRVSAASKELCEEVPLDTVLGIDTFIKFRLSEFEIEDVQNLATINPIQLFIETPYGLLESIDWVAQAQLIVAVGTAKTKRLRELNIRTIFDLEKTVFDPAFSRRLAIILVPDLTPTEATAVETAARSYVAGGARATETPWWNGDLHAGTSEVALDYRDLLQATVGLLRDDLHVLRLRQIWDVIRGRLLRRPADVGGDGQECPTCSARLAPVAP